MKTIRSILIANRGEIASRIARTCKKMGIKSIAVYSDADRSSVFVQDADLAVHIGESIPSASYLDQNKILSVAKEHGADAIHPGYGFLAENTAFAERCAKEGLIFIGPNPNAIRDMGSKSKAKALMEKHGVPTIPGYKGNDQSLEKLKSESLKIGFPVLLKATAGGGGKGMRIVHQESEIKSAIAAAKRESLHAFGDDELLVEKYIEDGRHIEFQIFGDQHGNTIHILERECSIQRRYQKVIEESPSPVLTETLRNEMGEAAVKAAKALAYDNAGTVEFIFDEKNQKYYFLEVNTRLQVEHPVTEEITGLDLVQLQIESAQGQRLSLKQEDITSNGYAIECRLYAEDASNNFMPVTGKIQRFEFPELEGLRIETAIESGSTISVFYDPMIAKIIIWDKDRPAAHRKMQYALRNLICLGTRTNQDFLLFILENPDFQTGHYSTHFIENKLDLNQLSSHHEENYVYAAIAACLKGWLCREAKRKLLRALPSAWRNNFYTHQTETYIAGEKEIELKYRLLDNKFQFLIDEHTFLATIENQTSKVLVLEINGIRRRFNLIQEENEFFIHNEQIGPVSIQLKDRLPMKETGFAKEGYEAPMAFSDC